MPCGKITVLSHSYYLGPKTLSNTGTYHGYRPKASFGTAQLFARHADCEQASLTPSQATNVLESLLKCAEGIPVRRDTLERTGTTRGTRKGTRRYWWACWTRLKKLYLSNIEHLCPPRFTRPRRHTPASHLYPGQPPCTDPGSSCAAARWGRGCPHRPHSLQCVSIIK